jgi:hypothetical protein
MDAFHRCLALEVPVVVIVVDPKDGKVADWYAHSGFRSTTKDRMVDRPF